MRVATKNNKIYLELSTDEARHFTELTNSANDLIKQALPKLENKGSNIDAYLHRWTPPV